MHSTYVGKGEEFWGTGLDHRDFAGHARGLFPGKNWLGVLLMEIRDGLGPESEYNPSSVDVSFVNGVAVILNDGEILTKPEVSVDSRATVNYSNNSINRNIRNASCFLCGEGGAYRSNLSPTQ